MKQKKKIRFDWKKIIAGSAVFLLVLSAIVFRNQIKSFAMPPASIIFINALSVDLTSDADDAVWGASGRVDGNVKFYTHVVGRSGDIDYYFWPDCYSSATLPTTATYAETVAACGAPNTYSQSPGRTLSYSYPDLEKNPSATGITFSYPQAGIKYPRIIVKRDGIYSPLTSIEVKIKPNVAFSASTKSTTVDPPETNFSPRAGTVIQAYYQDEVQFNWTVLGLPTTDTCIASQTPTTGSGLTWTGSKPLTGADVNIPVRLNGGLWKFKLHCNTSGDPLRNRPNSVELTFIVSPAIQLHASVVENPSLNATSPNGQTKVINNGGLGIPINSHIALTGTVLGGTFNSCTISSTPSRYLASPRVFNSPVTSGSITTLSLDVNTTFDLTCTYTASAVTATSFARIQAVISSGNCAFYGNNKISAMLFCNNSFSALGGADNLDMKGSVVAKGFDINSSSSYNVFFQYDQRLAASEPPGFKYLSIPRPKEVGN